MLELSNQLIYSPIYIHFKIVSEVIICVPFCAEVQPRIPPCCAAYSPELGVGRVHRRAVGRRAAHQTSPVLAELGWQFQLLFLSPLNREWRPVWLFLNCPCLEVPLGL